MAENRAEFSEESPSTSSSSPLLLNSSSLAETKSDDDLNPKPFCLCIWDSGFVNEIKRQLYLAGPLVLINFLQYFLQVISLMFAGHLGELALSGASVATSFANVTGFSILFGMGSALDTFCGQSYGAKQYNQLGIHTQRAIIVIFLATIPLSLIWAFTGPILVSLGQNSEISAQAGIYALWLIPSLFAYGLLQCHVRFLQCQNIVMPMVLYSIMTVIIHIPLCWFLASKTALGIRGAALATNISYWINVSLLVLYVNFSGKCRNTWVSFSLEAIRDLVAFLKLAIPSAFMTCLEYWAFEMVVLLAGFLPNPKLETSVLSITLNTMWMVYMIPTGLSSAISIRVSNELGSGNPEATRLAVSAAFIISLTQGLVIALITILVRDIWGYLYSNEIQVVQYVSTMMPILAFSDFMDGLQCTLSGVARGSGWQKICSLINLGSYYLVGIPCSVLFAFFLNFGGQGLWLGIICAMVVQLCALIWIIQSTNWNNEAMKASERVPRISISLN